MNRLREIRLSRGISQYALAKELGISRQRLSNYENGKRRLPVELAIHICRILNVTLEEIYGIETTQTA
ncbi:helix-turn-helix domain-containing protein [Caldicellulosiruptor acetigenus]|uniref:helix-turn-helix transcriptional regulator n=1 Tax=Caldicellulosiruptor acetigenus TaxID=301953 RepID=UPI0022A915DF|nr:helix-turn-helix transcriptional regulator [Caldicellulosiruptor acetigenus]WAM36617.1 helix-turn-helix domain-containing protein [Caldicellulosiruptor acetigenus]